MAKLMAKARDKVALYLALAGFSGIRSAELMRLEWKDFNFVRGHITVAADKAKTATRRLVPILPNLSEYLRPYHRATGHLFKMKDDKRAIAWARKNGVNPWPINCLRHSFASYRLAATADAARVALELGNSPAKLFSNYRELADEHDAAAWFAIGPKRPKNVVAITG
jgi:integrase